MKELLKQKKAITLIALVITIVVLVILAVVTISLTVGNDGLIERAMKAAKGYKDAQEKDKTGINDLYGQMLVAVNDDAQVTISLKELKDLIDERAEAVADAKIDSRVATIANEQITNSKQIAEVAFDTRTSYTTTADEQVITIPLASRNIVGNKLSAGSNGVVIGSGVSKVRVTYSFGIEAKNSTCGYFRTRLYKNTTGLGTTDTVNSVQYLMTLSKSCIIDVSQGDVIKGAIVARNAGQFYICNCNMVVEVIN